MALKPRRVTRKTGGIVLGALLVFIAAWTYRLFYPPVPAYLDLPPGSRTLASRRFHADLWGPKYYCRIHSPLSAWQTAHHMKKSSGFPGANPRAVEASESEEDIHGWALKRTGKYIHVEYSPHELLNEGAMYNATMRIWQEENGSTIEFYYATRF